MDLKETIKNLRELEKNSKRRHYIGDATNYAWKRHILILLSKENKKKRKSTEWNKFLSKALKEGKSISDASDNYWKSKQQK